MRLLEYTDEDGLALTKDFIGEDKIPPYAILSHVWEDGQEVTFTDVSDGIGKDKTGYSKIRFCKQQAGNDGLQYFWVDTCCIDKTNHVELQGAINSMFRWYQDAEKCYVYLSDVWTKKRKASDNISESTWENAFRGSRWFTRGWTLQELLAPRSVEFFSREGKKLGNKSTLERQIHEITGIDILALRGTPLSKFGIDERLSWAKNRQTTWKEDRAYSLLGLFGIYMPLIYGEGEENAFKRLRKKINRPIDSAPQQQASVRMEEKYKECIQHLRLTDPRHDKKRIEDTKGGLLEDSYQWVLENADFQRWRDECQSPFLWINGDPGKGKTMLLCGIINELKESIARTSLLSYFFCQATDPRINNAIAVLRGLMYLLVDQQPWLISHIKTKHEHAGKALFEDANAWVALCEIFTDMLQDPSLNSAYLIIDALDECVEGLPELLDLLVRTSSMTSRVKWIVSSRNWPQIKEHLEMAGQKMRLSLELNTESISKAVQAYIRHKVDQLAQRKQYDIRTRDTVFGYISSNANDTFLWVALICQNLEKIPRWKVLTKLKTFPPRLNSLYEGMMQHISDSDDATLCRRILALIAVVYEPITLLELSSLVEELEDMSEDLESVNEIIGHCGSFLTVRDGIIYLIHQSAKDFLLTEASNTIFPYGKDEVHYALSSRSLLVMSKTLRRDIYGLRSPGSRIDHILQPDPDPLAASRYSCIYWVDHLCDSKSTSRADRRDDLQDRGMIDVVIRKKFLYWLEALSLYKSMSKGAISIMKLEGLIQANADASVLHKLIKDARRFILSHQWAIENAPLQVYTSALVFSPTGSMIKALFKDEEPKWITMKPDMGDKWSTCLQSLEYHGRMGTVRSLVFSHNSTLLASTSENESINIWDLSSGKCLRTLKNGPGLITSLAFSHDSTQLASTSGDGTVKVWDMNNGNCLLTFDGCSGWVALMVMYHNLTWLVSTIQNQTLKIWDVNSVKCIQTLESCIEMFGQVAFSHNLKWLASASASGPTIKIWDISSGKCLLLLDDHDSYFSAVVFSHDIKQLASASGDGIAKIWDVNSGKCLQVFKGHGSRITALAFSHDSTRLASASYDQAVMIWGVSSGECLQIHRGHTDPVKAVAFSHDSTQLASGSDFGKIKIWDTSYSGNIQTLEDDHGPVTAVVFSHDSKQLASASEDRTVKTWDVSSGKRLQVFRGHFLWIRAVAFSHDSKQLASASEDNMAKIWDTTSGRCLYTLRGHTETVLSVAFSHDSARLASGSSDATIKIWDTSSGKCLQTLTGHSDGDHVGSVVFSHNSTRLASASYPSDWAHRRLASSSSTLKIWNASSGDCVQTLKDPGNDVYSMAFSHDSTRLASESYDQIIKIWDVNSGEHLHTNYSRPSLLKMPVDPSGQYLETNHSAISISTTSTSDMTPAVIEPQFPQYRSVAFRAYGVWVTCNSEKLLWLPPEYRPSCLNVSGKTIGIGTASGKVWLCNLGVNDP
ncbi:hypothetical protein GJ744_010620 [Endocarpon pusillum]|uniref:NACHT domain-containing protein n=1 Tax=Endocarpon pusillum TaxID=364733 RepID=A0A8H7ARW4_9EURO|nr:hypothetical protein GJ744_010620 [Endocarpon pusillum]